ncbi:MAG: GAF domain-containing protein [Spirochaetes bacterium]|nr:GAF domain-containing protein [Spirochaetota bacterium]MBU1081145.1 GAF domain-containing protein [Spirochaetota bacterium]
MPDGTRKPRSAEDTAPPPADGSAEQGRESEAAVQRSLLSSIIELSSSAIFAKDLAGRYVVANAACADIFGLPASSLIGRTDAELVPPDTAKAFRSTDELAISTGCVQELTESALIGKELHSCLIRKAPWRDGSGAIVGSVGISRDITATVLAEEEVARQKDRLERLVDILQHPAETTQEFLDFALGQAIALTDSSIGYIYRYDESSREFVLNTWSKGVMEACSVRNPSTRYELDRTGIWGDAVRERRAVVVNDFSAPDNRKKGYPECHVPLKRFMTVPVLRDGAIVGVVGLANKAEDYDSGDVLQVSLLMDVVWKVTEQKENEARIRELLEEKELLLKEVHHRVKNTLNTVISLLSLQSAGLTDEAATSALLDMESRVRSMSVLYDKLYRSASFDSVSTGEYLPAMVDEILAVFPARVRLTVEKRIEDFPLGVDKVQPLGILIGELLTNAMKYAFAGRSEGTILVSAERSCASAAITVEDDGVGLPEGIDFKNSTGFGLSLVASLAAQMRGSLRIERGGGTRITLEFPV